MDKNKPGMTHKSRKKMIAAGFAAVVILAAAAVRMVQLRKENHHHFYMRTVVIEATCSEDGLASYKCPGCGDEYEELIPRTGHRMAEEPEADGLVHTGECVNCGEEIQFMTDPDTGVTFMAPAATRTRHAAVTVVNSRGYEYDYMLYLQGGGYNIYSRYLKLHGCSTCALTTVLNAVSPELRDYTPDRVIDEIQPAVFGNKAFNKNYKGDRENGSMPVTLYGMTRIFDAYGIRYKLPASDRASCEAEITEHLRNGDPVIMTFAKGGTGGLSNSIHTIVLIGIDADGHVIIGDSLHKKSKNWGRDGLIKTRKLTVSDMVSYILNYGDWVVCPDNIDKGGNLYYHVKADRGYLLVYGDDPSPAAGTGEERTIE